jgi:hypothetical protein
MEVKAADVAINRGSRVQLAVVEAFVERYLELTHLKLQFKSYVSYRFLTIFNAFIVNI